MKQWVHFTEEEFLEHFALECENMLFYGSIDPRKDQLVEDVWILKIMKKITRKELDRLLEMINSSDRENRELVETITKTLTENVSNIQRGKS